MADKSPNSALQSASRAHAEHDLRSLASAITGFVLSGGRSQRMGRDKALLPWGKSSLLGHAVERMQSATERGFVVGPHALPGTPTIKDEYPGCGPLAGIQAALKHTSTDWNLVLAVDLPLVPASFLGFLRELASLETADALVPRTGDKLHSLCAAYRRRLLPIIESRLSRGELAVAGLLDEIQLRVIEEPELLARGFTPAMFSNVNTPEELEAARRQMHRRA